MRRLLLVSALALAPLMSGGAQAQRLDVQTMNFDLWCQETQHLPVARCDKRLPEDEATFEAYRAKVEKYETDYLRGQEAGAQLNRTILHNDPVDNPVDKNASAAEQKPTTPGQTRSTP